MSSTGSRVSASTAFHRAVQQAGRLFGGRYGQRPTTLPEPESRLVDLGDVKLRVLLWDGPPPAVVMLHGLNNNAWSWARVASLIAPRRRVVAVCQRGHGGSTAPATGYGLKHTSTDLLRVIDALSLGAVDLVGHSWGGKVATHFNTEHPDRVRSLALADPALPRGLNGVIRTFPSLTTLSLRAERGPFADRASWEHAGRSVNYLRHWDDTDQKLWAAGFVQRDDGSYRHTLPETGFEEVLQEALAEDLDSRLSSIAGPVLLMRPTFTLSFLPGEVESMRRALPQMVERRVPGDHTFIHTNPMDTAAVLGAFLQIRR